MKLSLEMDLMVLSHLRWDSVFQRPQHLMTRYAGSRRVFYIEEPVFIGGVFPKLQISERREGVIVVTPQLSPLLSSDEVNDELSYLLTKLVHEYKIEDFTAWYYTPLALAFTRDLRPSTVIYDCMDRLSTIHGTPANLVRMETELLERADLVFTGGESLYETKRHRHSNVYPFPSGIDIEHFWQARGKIPEPIDQKYIQGPRLGFFGIIDDRFDMELVRGIAKMRPDWQLIFIGPVLKIDPTDLPRYSNIHYLGMKDYHELPAYIAGWDIAMLPFSRNESTQFITPTKIPEYLAAGRPVISTSIRDVIRPYAEEGLVGIADTPEDFVNLGESFMMNRPAFNKEWSRNVDKFLSTLSWDKTHRRMLQLEYETRAAYVSLLHA